MACGKLVPQKISDWFIISLEYTLNLSGFHVLKLVAFPCHVIVSCITKYLKFSSSSCSLRQKCGLFLQFFLKISAISGPKLIDKHAQRQLENIGDKKSESKACCIPDENLSKDFLSVYLGHSFLLLVHPASDDKRWSERMLRLETRAYG